MVLIPTVLVAATLVGWLAGGRLRNLARVRLRAVWLVAAAAACQVLLGALAGAGVLPAGAAPGWARALLAVSHAAVLAFVLANRVLPGMPLVLLGLLLNVAVMTANGGMPVAPEALAAAGGGTEVEAGKHRLLEDGDVLPWLADVIPLRPLRTVVSVGDGVLAAGVGLLVLDLMRRDVAGCRVPGAGARAGQGGSGPELPA